MIENYLKEIASKIGVRFPNAEFSKNLGFAKGVVSEYLNNKKRVSNNFIEQLENYYDISYENMIIEISNSSIPSEEYEENHDNIATFPLIPIEAVAGFPTDDLYGVRYEDCPQYRIPDFENKGVDYLIRVSGSSMYPKYSNGDVLACKKITDIFFFQWGKVYVIDSSQGALVKRIFEDENNPDNILCVSDNRDNYPPFSMPKSDIRSLSIVLGVVRIE